MMFQDMTWLLLLIGFMVGLVVGATGVGGGALMTPLLIALTPTPLVSIIATDLLFAAAIKIVVSFRNLRRNSIDWNIVRSLWIGAIPATLVFSFFLAVLFPSWLDASLALIIGALVIFAGFRFLSDVGQRQAPISRKRLPFIGAILGGSVSLTSIGAGAFGMALLRPHWPHTKHVSGLVATDIVQAIPIALLAGLVHLSTGTFDFGLFLAITPTGVIGALLGSLVIAKTTSQSLMKILGLMLVTAGLLAVVAIF